MLLSAIQLKNGLKKGEPTYLAACLPTEQRVIPTDQRVPAGVEDLLVEFADVMPPELPKELPPRRGCDHAIELLPGTRAPAQAPYRMAPKELAKLRR